MPEPYLFGWKFSSRLGSCCKFSDGTLLLVLLLAERWEGSLGGWELEGRRVAVRDPAGVTWKLGGSCRLSVRVSVGESGGQSGRCRGNVLAMGWVALVLRWIVWGFASLSAIHCKKICI